jgi:hypothetical protein
MCTYSEQEKIIVVSTEDQLCFNWVYKNNGICYIKWLHLNYSTKLNIQCFCRASTSYVNRILGSATLQVPEVLFQHLTQNPKATWVFSPKFHSAHSSYQAKRLQQLRLKSSWTMYHGNWLIITSSEGRYCVHLQNPTVIYTSWTAWPWRRRHYRLSKRQELFTNRHGITSQKIWIFRITTVGTGNVTFLTVFRLSGTRKSHEKLLVQ